MDHKPGTVRTALVGTTAALCLASTLLAGACAIRVPVDVPAMGLTEPVSADAQTTTQPSQ